VRSENLPADGLVEITPRQGRKCAPPARLAPAASATPTTSGTSSGYHRDAIGEARLVAFTFAQTRAVGWAVLAIGAALRPARAPRPLCQGIWQGYRRQGGRLAAGRLRGAAGRAADAARARLGITPPTYYDAILPTAATAQRRRSRRFAAAMFHVKP
jgi:ubiquinone biosynthesis protein COQ4